MKRNSDARCTNCVYWRINGPSKGSCYRFPPKQTILAKSGNEPSDFVFPVTYSSDVCGEHPDFRMAKGEGE